MFRKSAREVTSQCIAIQPTGNPDEPIGQPAYQLGLVNEPSPPTAARRIAACLELGKVIGTAAGDVVTEPVSTVSVATCLTKETRLQVGNGVLIGVDDNLATALCKHGFYEVPEGFEIGVYAEEPGRVEVTGAIKAGENQLEIEVVNRWPNRMIGDKQPADANARTVECPHGFFGGHKIQTGRYTFSTSDPFNADSPLLPSGLLGPVRVMSGE